MFKSLLQNYFSFECIEKKDLLLIWGVIFAPFTALRIIKFGPGEILLIIWMIIVITKNPQKISLNFISKFQIYNLIIMAIGFAINATFFSKQLSISIIIDYFSHVFMFFLVLALSTFYKTISLNRIHEIIKYISLWGAPVYLLLFIYGYFISTSFLGIKMWIGYKTRFMALALNPHQIGMITGSMIFFTLYLMEYFKKFKSLYFIVSLFIWYFISVTIKSDTLTAVYVLLILSFVILKIVKIPKDYNSRMYLCFFIFFVGLIILLSTSQIIFDKFHKFVSEAGNGDGRIELWLYSLNRLSENPFGLIIGLGPGSNTGLYMLASGNEMEAHNTYVQQMLNGGITIVICYFIMIFNLCRNFLYNNTFLVLNILYFVLYGCGGNMNRRALMWFTYATVLAIFDKNTILA